MMHPSRKLQQLRDLEPSKASDSVLHQSYVLHHALKQEELVMLKMHVCIAIRLIF